MSRAPLDTWSKREQLCLASAVSCSGDQNWITVSRTLKSVCGNGNTRPADWYSQKNCAVQYGHLLESVETTKRKKRTNESSAGFSSPATVAVETPTEILLRRLTEERLIEIKTQMRRDQELYSKMQREIESLQSDMLSEQQLQQMWQEIEKEQETKRINEMKLENRMREREQRKKDVATNWRNNNPSGRRSNLTADTTSVDMDVEDISDTSAAGANNKQPAAPAPLLTSLLKSPGNNNTNTVTSPTGNPAVPGIGSVARATAPTITSLLTSGAGTIPNQPAIVMKSPNDSAFMTRPISGPPLPEVATTSRSPSQAAPTLSMLLEKNKLAAAAAAKANESTRAIDTESNPIQKPQATPEETSEAVDESDAEEQQLLEVFKNIDDIMDDIDIDIDEDLLKEVSAVDSPPPAMSSKGEVVDFEDKLDALKLEQGPSRKSSKSPTETKTPEVVIGSSDDSNDNIPLAAVASQESKDRSQSTTENTNTATDSITHDAVVDELSETITIASSSSDDNPQEIHAEAVSDKAEAAEAIIGKPAAPVNESATQELGKDAEEQQDLAANTDHQETVAEASKEDDAKSESDKAATATSAELKASNVLTISGSVHDTDEESSSLTDSSKVDEPGRGAKTKQQSDHKSETEAASMQRQTPSISSNIAPAPAPVTARAPLLRKLPHRDRSESPMVDDDTTTASDHSTARSSTRRRCSSTPVIDSIPNSPASSEHTDDRRETRAASKKLFLSIYSTLLESKYASPFRRPFHDEHAHADLCLRPMDLPTIRRNIDSGHLRSISELHRDVLLMCHNLLLLHKPQSPQHKTARVFLQECQAVKEFVTHSSHSQSDNSITSTTASVSSKGDKEKEKERTPAGTKARSGSRKSQRHH